jgi:hypothetical protein
MTASPARRGELAPGLLVSKILALRRRLERCFLASSVRHEAETTCLLLVSFFLKKNKEEKEEKKTRGLGALNILYEGTA